jgi:hypothetical protein
MGNDFSDFQQYFIKCTIPQALARIKDGSGDTRNKVKLFLINILKFNDNSNNYVLSPTPFLTTIPSLSCLFYFVFCFFCVLAVRRSDG